jgi:hypothetical protein
MAIIKCSLLFKATTAPTTAVETPRTGGWSEQYIFSGSFSDAANATNSLAAARAKLLPNNTAVVGQRMQQISPAGGSQTFRKIFPGAAGLAQDIPQMALNYNLRASNGLNVLRRQIRGLPDARVVNGAYQGSRDYDNAIILWDVQLDNYVFIAIDKSQPKIPVVNVQLDGTFTLMEDMTFAVGDRLQAYRMVDNFKQAVKGLYPVKTRTDARHGVLDNWTAVAVVTKGFLRKYIRGPIPISGSEPALGGVTTHKVGRPFDQYVGRRSARK